MNEKLISLALKKSKLWRVYCYYLFEILESLINHSQKVIIIILLWTYKDSAHFIRKTSVLFCLSIHKIHVWAFSLISIFNIFANKKYRYTWTTLCQKEEIEETSKIRTYMFFVITFLKNVQSKNFEASYRRGQWLLRLRFYYL